MQLTDFTKFGNIDNDVAYCESTEKYYYFSKGMFVDLNIFNKALEYNDICSINNKHCARDILNSEYRDLSFYLDYIDDEDLFFEEELPF